ncbi:MAG TPA: hypothetical protein VKA91_07165 [Nitrososphaeraceae archaeon]|nr:hypothetical protein [Nitrososphaeraceae archaeon]
MDNYYLGKKLQRELQEAMRVKELNVELIEHLGSMGIWILKYCERNNIKPPDTDRLLELIQRSREIVQRMYEPYSHLPSPTQNQQHFKHEDDSTEPILLFADLKSHIYCK